MKVEDISKGKKHASDHRYRDLNVLQLNSNI